MKMLVSVDAKKPNPIQTQFKPNQTQNKPNQTQNKPNFSQNPILSIRRRGDGVFKLSAGSL